MKKEENIEKGKKSINNQPAKDYEKKRSFTLPQTESKPPMPQVKPPKMN